MSFFDLFRVQVHAQDCIDAYNKLSNNKVCNFYLEKIPKYCSIDKILWIEADVIENACVKSFRINYYHERLGENIDTKISFHRYGHHSMPVADFREFMKFLSVGLHKNKFIFFERGFDDCNAGCLYDRKYAKKMFSI